MGSDGTKLRAAEWLYRWNLSLSILGVVFTILTFLGVFTLVLGPVFARLGMSYFETSLILATAVVLVIISFGVFLDKVVKFWAAQATVGTVRNPYLVDVLYQKELLGLIHIQRPVLSSIRSLLDAEVRSSAAKDELLADLDRSIAKVERAIAEKRWPVERHEKVY